VSDEKQPTHMLVPVGAFRLFDAIADLALRQGGLEAHALVNRFTAQAKPYTPPVPAALKAKFDDAKKQQAAGYIDPYVFADLAARFDAGTLTSESAKLFEQLCAKKQRAADLVATINEAAKLAAEPKGTGTEG